MNETNSLKLHKMHKILCVIVCFVIVLSLSAFSASAEEATIKAGTYTFNNTITPIPQDSEFIRIAGDFSYVIPEFVSNGVTASCIGSRISYNYGSSGDGTNYNNAIINLTGLWTFGDQSAEAPIAGGVSADGSIDNLLSLITIIVETDQSVDAAFKEWFDANTSFTPSTPSYDGNPWVDILNGVMEAIDVNIFGYFSYLDIVSTLVGACLCIWLLKMLAGG